MKNSKTEEISMVSIRKESQTEILTIVKTNSKEMRDKSLA